MRGVESDLPVEYSPYHDGAHRQSTAGAWLLETGSNWANPCVASMFVLPCSSNPSYKKEPYLIEVSKFDQIQVIAENSASSDVDEFRFEILYSITNLIRIAIALNLFRHKLKQSPMQYWIDE